MTLSTEIQIVNSKRVTNNEIAMDGCLCFGSCSRGLGHRDAARKINLGEFSTCLISGNRERHSLQLYNPDSSTDPSIRSCEFDTIATLLCAKSIRAVSLDDMSGHSRICKDSNYNRIV